MGKDKSNNKNKMLFRIGYWGGFVLSSISFFMYSLMSGLALIPGLNIFANPLKVGFGILANAAWIGCTACEEELGLIKIGKKSKRSRVATYFSDMSEYELFAGISGIGAAVAIGISLLIPPLGVALAFTSTLMVCASNHFWSKGEEARLKTLIAKEPYKELHKDIWKAHKMQIKYAKLSTLSSISILASIACSVIFPPAAPIALGLAALIVGISATYKARNIHLNSKISKRKKELKEKDSVVSEDPEDSKLIDINNELTKNLKIGAHRFSQRITKHAEIVHTLAMVESRNNSESITKPLETSSAPSRVDSITKRSSYLSSATARSRLEEDKEEIEPNIETARTNRDIENEQVLPDLKQEKKEEVSPKKESTRPKRPTD